MTLAASIQNSFLMLLGIWVCWKKLDPKVCRRHTREKGQESYAAKYLLTVPTDTPTAAAIFHWLRPAGFTLPSFRTASFCAELQVAGAT